MLASIGVGLIIIGILGTIVTHITKSHEQFGSIWAKLVLFGVLFIIISPVISIF